MDPWYATREDVMSATDVKASARTGAQIDADLNSASRTAEGLIHRKFYPWTGSRSFDWPDGQVSRSWRVWFDQFDLNTLTSVTNGDGSTISTANIFLNPQDGPPYEWAEVSLASSSAFSAGNTWQRAITFTGTWGWANDQGAAGTITSAVNASVLSVPISDSSLIGIGSLITIGTERLRVSGKALASTTATLSADLTASAGITSIGVSSGTLVNVGETVTVGAESMQVVDKAGNTLVVKRAISGSVLAAHTSGDTVYAPRTLTVERAATGTTAASALSGAAVTVWQPPGPLRNLTTAIAVQTAQMRIGGWSATRKTATTSELTDLLEQVRAMYSRMRTGAV